MNHAQQRKDIGYLLNRKFGQLTVIGESPTRPRKGLWVTVRCDCGVERIARARSLEHGKQKTCGTLAHRNGERLAKGADLVGLRFGSLVVLRASPAPLTLGGDGGVDLSPQATARTHSENTPNSTPPLQLRHTPNGDDLAELKPSGDWLADAIAEDMARGEDGDL